jgi:hypothetical protein
MDLSHRLPYPPCDSYCGIFSISAANEYYRDVFMRNIKKVSVGLTYLTKIIPKLSELEIFACFCAARFSFFNNSPKVRRDALHLLIGISKTFMAEHTIPYFMMLTHDENAQIKQEATTSLALTTKKCGGLRKHKAIVVSAIGSIGAISFSNPETNRPEEILSRSRMSSCSILAATQILSTMKAYLEHREIAEMIQYIRKATTILVQTLSELDKSSNETLFFSPKLRACLYRLYQETITIPRCPHPEVSDLIKETDRKCLKYAGPLIASLCGSSGWDILLENSALLNSLYDEFLKNADQETVNRSLSKNLSIDNLKKGFQFLLDKNYKDIDIQPFSKCPEIWNSLPEDFLKLVINSTRPVIAKYVPRFKKYFTDVSSLEFTETSPLDEVADALIAVAKPCDIILIEEKWPNVICRCIKKWKITPKTDWWSDIISKNLKRFAEEDAAAIEMVIPKSEKDAFHSLIAEIIVEKLNKLEEVSSDMWEITELTQTLVSRIIELNPSICVEQTRKQEIYSNVYQAIKQTRGESEAGEMIGMLTISSNTTLEEFPESYEFLSHFFKVVSIDNVPESVELQFLNDYFRISYPDFELHFFLKKFEESILDSSISRFVLQLSDEKRQKLLDSAIEKDFIDVAIVLIATSKNKASLRVTEKEWILPFLRIIKIPTTSSTEFAKFLRGDDFDIKSIESDPNEELWYAALSKATIEEINDIAAKVLPAQTSLNFHLFLVALDNAKLPPKDNVNHLLNALLSLECIPQLNNETIEVLTRLFVRVSEVDSDGIIAFATSISSYLSTSQSQSILQCLRGSIMSFLEAVPRDSWEQLRDALSMGTVAGPIEFDAVVCQKFTDTDHSLFRAFPTAAAKYYQSHYHKDRLRSSLSQLCQSLVKEIIDKALSANIDGVSIRAEDNTIICDYISSDDDEFTLRVIIPNEFPLLPPMFDVSPLGKEKLTQDTRDEVKREFLRKDGIICSISTWAARIDAVVTKIEVCPICLSLLDHGRNLPKMKCSTCYKVMHSGCIEMWLKHSLKKNCPCCRAKWKRLK